MKGSESEWANSQFTTLADFPSNNYVLNVLIEQMFCDFALHCVVLRYIINQTSESSLCRWLHPQPVTARQLLSVMLPTKGNKTFWSIFGKDLKLRSFSKEPHQVSSEDEDYPFVEQPSDDFFCPVTMGLLLHPHLTSCCGNHISEEAAARIMGEGGVCPLCKKKDWSTMLNKHFQRQVNSLRVFCRHEDRGCGWQGELGAFHHHVEICPMRDSLPMTELVKLPV